MTRLDRAEQARQVLDRRFATSDVRALTGVPARGWIRAVRDALGMTTRQMARRMGISQPAISQLERSEASGVIQLDTLRRAADALDCDLLYALVPRVGLQETVRRRSIEQARKRVGAVDQTMQLEDQGLDDDRLRERVELYAGHLVDSSRIWDDVL
jgi:predicted DNA-binding mobile mystery protein A